MKTLIAVMGAEPHILNGMHQLQRETWGQDAHLLGDLRFFLGRGEVPLQEDEVMLDCGDDLLNLMHKDEEIFRWALRRGYEGILKVDTDSYVNAAEIARQDYSGLDYVGSPTGTLGEFYAGTEAYSFLQGSATWFSAKAARIAMNEAVTYMRSMKDAFMRFNGVICPYPQSDDLWTAQVFTPYLRRGELRALPDRRYTNGPLTFHFGHNKQAPFWMEKFRAWAYGLHASRMDHGRMAEIHARRMA